MSCRNLPDADRPAVLWLVAWKPGGQHGNRPQYYTGPKSGWSFKIEDGAVWPSAELASAVAACWSGAIAVRVLVWEPLPRLLSPDAVDTLIED